MNDQDFHITIPKPCHENWDKMTVEEKGRHCKVCNKTIADFTHSNKTEIINQLELSNETICGRIPSTYVSQVIRYPTSRLHFSYKLFGSFLAFIGLSTLFWGDAQAQNVQQDSSQLKLKQTSTRDFFWIRGIVKDRETGKPLDFASVIAQAGDTILGNVLTDDDGIFAIHVPPGHTTITLKCSYISYYNLIMPGIPVPPTQSISIQLQKSSSLEMTLGILIRSQPPMIDPWGGERKDLQKR